MREKIKKCCTTCDWHDDFSGVCVNGNSPHCADFTMPESCCREWELLEDLKHERRDQN